MSENNPFENVNWVDALTLPMEGMPFREGLESPWDRLPLNLKKDVRPEVWELSTMPTGGCVLFETDSTNIYADWEIMGDDFSNMGPTVGRGLIAGLDLYALDSNGNWTWVGLGDPWQFPSSKGRLHRERLRAPDVNINPYEKNGLRQYKLYLPIGRRLKSLKIGYENTCRFEKGQVSSIKPIVTYGTSICHGFHTSRPGMIHPLITSRALHTPWVNMSFSGNARMEKPIVDSLAKIDAQLYIIDCLPNMDESQVRENMPELIETLKEKQPNTPILFVPDRLFGDAPFTEALLGGASNSAGQKESRYDMQVKKSQWQKEVFDEYVNNGFTGLHLGDMENFFGDDFDGTDDGSHPTDLGMWRMAQYMVKEIRKIL